MVRFITAEYTGGGARARTHTHTHTDVRWWCSVKFGNLLLWLLTWWKQTGDDVTDQSSLWHTHTVKVISKNKQQIHRWSPENRAPNRGVGKKKIVSRNSLNDNFDTAKISTSEKNKWIYIQRATGPEVAKSKQANAVETYYDYDLLIIILIIIIVTIKQR